MNSELIPSDGRVACDYCQGKAKLVGGDVIYPHRPDLASKQFWACLPCDAYVGCHPGTVRPLGRLANAELRRAKMSVHAVFDPIWERRLMLKRQTDPRYNKGMARGGRYKKLAELMGIPRAECHVGMFDVARCLKAVEIIKSGALEEA